MSTNLLHPEAYRNTLGDGPALEHLMEARAGEVQAAALGQPDPDVTVLIRTRNQVPQLADLLEDIGRQQFDGEVQLVVVDTESTDGTTDVAKAHGASIVPIRQASFNYADSLNKGFEAADHPFVFTLVGHSRLATDMMFRGISPWAARGDVGGGYGAALPDSGSTLGDYLIYALHRNRQRLQPTEELDHWRPGALVAHRSVVRRAVWQELGGYDESFGNGGEDTDFARRVIAEGLKIVREPVFSVHHSYGLNLPNTFRQMLAHYYYGRGAHEHAFDQKAHALFRPDMGPKETLIH